MFLIKISKINMKSINSFNTISANNENTISYELTRSVNTTLYSQIIEIVDHIKKGLSTAINTKTILKKNSLQLVLDLTLHD